MCSLERIEEVLRTNEKAIEFLREKRILRRLPPLSETCDNQMMQVKRNETPDGYVWSRPKHKGRKKSIRRGLL